MLLIKRSQLQKFVDKRVDDFINMQIGNLKEKQENKMLEMDEHKIYGIIHDLVIWADTKGVSSMIDLENFINICIIYNVTKNGLQNPSISDIFNYPDRMADQKIVHFHMYLASMNYGKQ